MKNLIKFQSILWLTVTAFTLTSFSSIAQENTKKDAKDRNEAKFSDEMDDDSDMLVNAYSSGMVEIQMAESVKGRTTSDDIKMMAGKMIAAHTDMNNEIKTLAVKKNVSLPTELTKMQMDDIDQVAKLSGTELDEKYVNKLVMSHKKSVHLFEKGSTKAEDAEIRALFTKGLPVVREHLQMAENMQDRMKERQEKRSNME